MKIKWMNTINCDGAVNSATTFRHTQFQQLSDHVQKFRFKPDRFRSTSRIPTGWRFWGLKKLSHISSTPSSSEIQSMSMARGYVSSYSQLTFLETISAYVFSENEIKINRKKIFCAYSSASSLHTHFNRRSWIYLLWLFCFCARVVKIHVSTRAIHGTAYYDASITQMLLRDEFLDSKSKHIFLLTTYRVMPNNKPNGRAVTTNSQIRNWKGIKISIKTDSKATQLV